jgi:hypothetical protein
MIILLGDCYPEQGKDLFYPSCETADCGYAGSYFLHVRKDKFTCLHEHSRS